MNNVNANVSYILAMKITNALESTHMVQIEKKWNNRPWFSIIWRLKYLPNKNRLNRFFVV